MPRRALRVVLAEDSVLLREGIVALLEQFQHSVVATVGDPDSLVAAVEEHRPDIVITDIRMPPAYSNEGLVAAGRLRQRHPELPVLLLSQYVASAYATEMITNDRSQGRGLGYLLKDRVGDVAEFVDIVERVAAGRTVIDPAVIAQLLDPQQLKQPVMRLTPREREVLGLMAEGKSNQGIAQTLQVTDAAVAKHIGRIFEKLGLEPDDGNRRVLAVLAYLRG